MLLKGGAEPAVHIWGCRLLLMFVSFSVCKDKLAANGAVDSQRSSQGSGLAGRENDEEAEHGFPLEQEAVLSKF